MAERLMRARDSCEHTSSKRRQLFADITHELATPLTSIRAPAETLLDPHVPHLRGRAHALRARRARGVAPARPADPRPVRARRLEAGATPLELERLDWRRWRGTRSSASHRGTAAGLALAPGAMAPEAWVAADGARIEQVLDNLLVNALRYVPAAGT
jgi:signal transduction histidine kinase